MKHRHQKSRARLAENVQILRAQHGLTQAELADAAGITGAEVSYIERCGRDPELSTLIGLRRAFRVTWATLLNGVH